MNNRRHRVALDLPADLVREAVDLAQGEGGVMLATVVHAEVVACAKLAEAGMGHLLPRRLPRRPRGKSRAVTAQVVFTASRVDARRYSAALAGAGSSTPTIVVATLQAYVAAKGAWMDARMPSEWWAPMAAPRDPVDVTGGKG